MADARDRTVATNYAREAMEDVKNIDFELVTNENLGTAESVGEKFTRVISVNTENGNLKKITTLVYWNNRNGKTINIETSMYINRTLFNPGEAAKIVLYAIPYYSVLPSTDETIDLIAVIKDAKGNTKIDWSGENICFTIISGSELGSLPVGVSDGVDTNGGIAETIFTPSNYKIDGVVQQGDVVIEASVELLDGSTISDRITITVTLDVVRIELLAVPDSIEANGTDGANISTVTATLVNSGGVPVLDAQNEITFNISGEGTFVDSGGSPLPDIVLMAPSEGTGTATIYVKSIIDIPGVATVTASSEGLLSDTVNIITIGIATSIFVSVEPNLIYEGDNARVTVEIQDMNGNPVEYGENISLAISGGTGNFTDNPVGPDTTPLAYSTFFSPTSLGILTITASGGDLVDGTTTIEVGSTLIADTITIKADPKNISAGGDIDSEITATIKQGSTVISNYDHDITFKIISDTSSLHNALLSFNGDTWGIGELLTVTGEKYGNDGVAVVNLKPASYVGICTIEVSTDTLVGSDPILVKTIEVGFYSGEDHIELKAFPSKMLVDGYTCTVTAEVVDEGGNIVTSYNGDITFTILVGWPKIAKFALTGTSSLTQTVPADPGGIIDDVVLISQSKAGTVTLKASSFTGMTDITGYLNIPVDINFLDLVPDSVSYSPEGVKNIVSFDIDVQGAELLLEEMKVSWLPYNSETLNKIEIRSPNTADPITIFDNSDFPAFSGDIINVDDIILSTGESNVKIYFNQDISGKNILDVTFNPNSGDYTVNLIP
jgi:hypothetical protein